LLRVGIAVLTLVTAAIHFSLLFPDPVFILNALGYLGLLAASFVPVAALERLKPLVRLAFVGYAALTLILWLVMGVRTAIGYLSVVDELALIALLLIERTQTRAPAGP
jgi:hypothetical protein